MGVASRAGKFLKKLSSDPDPYVSKEAKFAATQVETAGMSKKDLEAMAKKGSADDKTLANQELERRASNKEIKKDLKKQVEEGTLSEKKAKNKYEYRRTKPYSGEDARDRAAKARDKIYDESYYDDAEEMAKGGLVKKARNHPLNKFYGK